MKIIEEKSWRSHGMVNQDDDMVRATIDFTKQEFHKFKGLFVTQDTPKHDEIRYTRIDLLSGDGTLIGVVNSMTKKPRFTNETSIHECPIKPIISNQLFPINAHHIEASVSTKLFEHVMGCRVDEFLHHQTQTLTIRKGVFDGFTLSKTTTYEGCWFESVSTDATVDMVRVNGTVYVTKEVES
jgi:hypothetical protein